jgi:4-amino-4-deoxy-L-arabinose transferase-like glycosyltransferase
MAESKDQGHAARSFADIPAEHWALFGLILVGGVLRLLWIGDKSLWVDEAHALRIAQGTLGEIHEFCARPGSHEPALRYYLMHFLDKMSPALGGKTEFLIRLPALITGIALIPIVWGLANRLTAKPAGLIAALFAMLSPLLIDHSQDARYYTVFLALEFGGLLALLSAWEAPERRGLWATAGLASALAFHISYLSVFVAAPVGAICLVLLARPVGVDGESAHAARRGALIALASMGVLLVGWVIPLLRAVKLYLGMGEALPLANPQPAHLIVTRHIPDWQFDWLAELVHPMTPGALALVAFAGAGLWAVARRRRWNLAVLGLIVVCTGVIALGTSMRLSLNPRYLLHFHVLALVLAGVGLGHLARARVGMVVAAAIAAGVSLTMLPAVKTSLVSEKQNWKAAVELIESNLHPRDIIITGALWSEQPVYHYAGPRARQALRMHALSEAHFELLRLTHAHAWFVGWGEIPDFIQVQLDEDFTLVDIFPGTRGDVYVWRKAPNPQS